jgi:hypothetical protein
MVARARGPRTPEGLERSRRANWKHGHFSREAKAERSRVRAAILAVRFDTREERSDNSPVVLKRGQNIVGKRRGGRSAPTTVNSSVRTRESFAFGEIDVERLGLCPRLDPPDLATYFLGLLVEYEWAHLLVFYCSPRTLKTLTGR